ncbi:MAG: Gfo/Idh/MocA family oxidoreductase [Candidatus Cyclobacteriaceae bacterium M3_2C_046]
MKNFALIGVGGYIAPRHLKAIKDTNNRLMAAVDPNDSVGIMDRFFPNAHFFIEFERFDRHIDKLRRSNDQNKADYVSICSPNYLHDSHIRFALRNDAQAICEKPMVLNPWNIDYLEALEKESGKKINNILQLRLHPSIIELKNKVDREPDKIHDIDLTYLTSRGKWYYISWKGNMQKSGGIATNIGVHFFDMLTWIFGDVKQNKVHIHDMDTAAGFLQLEKANVRWFLSLDYQKIPEEVRLKGQRTFRSIKVDGEEIEFSNGFTDLHTKSYQHILDGNGFTMKDVRTSINVVHDIRNAKTNGLTDDFHPFCLKENKSAKLYEELFYS